MQNSWFGCRKARFKVPGALTLNIYRIQRDTEYSLRPQPLRKCAAWADFHWIGIPFIASDLGNFFGGVLSDYLIKPGWSLGAARKALGGVWRLWLAVVHPDSIQLQLVGDHCALCLGHIFLRFLFDDCQRAARGSFQKRICCLRNGMNGAGGGIGTITAFLLIGHFSDARQAAAAHSFDPIVIVAGMVPFVAVILVLLLVPNTRATEEGLVRRI